MSARLEDPVVEGEMVSVHHCLGCHVGWVIRTALRERREGLARDALESLIRHCPEVPPSSVARMRESLEKDIADARAIRAGGLAS